MGHLRSNDRTINTYCTPVQDKNPPNHFTMNVAITFVVLALVACAHSAPQGSYSTNKMFEGALDDIQGSLADIKIAEGDLASIEGRLGALAEGKADIADVDVLLDKAVDKNAYPEQGQNGYLA